MIRPSRESWPPMPASTDNSKCWSRPVDNPTEQVARSRRLSSTSAVEPTDETGCRRKIAARLMLRISRKSIRNWLSIASAFNECVRMPENSFNTPRLWAAPSEATAAIGSDRGAVSRTVCAGHGGSWRIDSSAGQSRSTKVFSMRARTGLVST